MKRIVTLMAAVMFAVPAFALDEVQMEASNVEAQQSVDLSEELLATDEALSARYYTCVARNNYGQRFRASDYQLYRAQRKSFRMCQRNTPQWGRCQVVRCVAQQTGGGWGTN